jgi:hypothetical protein
MHAVCSQLLGCKSSKLRTIIIYTNATGILPICESVKEREVAHRQIQVSPHAGVRAGERGFTESVIRFVAKRVTTHAAQRAAERGFHPALIEFVIKHGDVCIPVRNGRRALSVSPAQAKLLGFLGVRRDFLDSIRSCTVIEQQGVVITVHRGPPSGCSTVPSGLLKQVNANA